LQGAHPDVFCVVFAEFSPPTPVSVCLRRVVSNGLFRKMEIVISATLGGMWTWCHCVKGAGRGKRELNSVMKAWLSGNLFSVQDLELKSAILFVFPSWYVTSVGPAWLPRWRHAMRRRKRSGILDGDLVDMRVLQLTVGMLSLPRNEDWCFMFVMEKRTHMARNTAASSTSEFVILPWWSRTSFWMSAGQSSLQTIGWKSLVVHGSHTPPAPSALESS